MAAVQTRLLVLAAVSLFEPLNGSQVLRELTGWGADRWGKVRPGSVYSMLATLGKSGFVDAHVLADGAREVTVYTMTDAGAGELDRTFARLIAEPDPANPMGFYAAVSQAGLLSRGRFVELLRERLAAGEVARQVWEHVADRPRPPVVAHSTSLWLRTAEVERAWVEETVTLVDGGGLVFRGEPGAGQHPVNPDLEAERERYRGLLGGAERAD